MTGSRKRKGRWHLRWRLRASTLRMSCEDVCRNRLKGEVAVYKSVSQDFCHVIVAAKSNNHGRASTSMDYHNLNNTITQTDGHILEIRVFLL